MAPPQPAATSLPAIICLDPGGDIWRRLRSLLEDDALSSEFILTRASESSPELLDLCRRLVPALLVLAEEHLPHIPLVGLRDLIGPTGVQILLVSEATSFSSLEYFFRQGCCGVVPFSVSDDTLLKAIRSLFAGELWLPGKLISHIAREIFLQAPAPQLTPREADIFRLISLGHTNQEIADQCFISRETVRWHIRSLYSKIGVDSREGAIREAKFFRGLTPSPLPNGD
jgi:DNA-binding NarL/FixJ family response regulator